MHKLVQFCFAFTAYLTASGSTVWAQTDGQPDLTKGPQNCGDAHDLETARIVGCDRVIQADPAPRQLALPPSTPAASAEQEPADPPLADEQAAAGTVQIGRDDQQAVAAPEASGSMTSTNPRAFAWYKGAALPPGLTVRDGQSTPDGYEMQSGAAHNCYLPECIWLVPAQ